MVLPSSTAGRLPLIGFDDILYGPFDKNHFHPRGPSMRRSLVNHCFCPNPECPLHDLPQLHPTTSRVEVPQADADARHAGRNRIEATDLSGDLHGRRSDVSSCSLSDRLALPRQRGRSTALGGVATADDGSPRSRGGVDLHKATDFCRHGCSCVRAQLLVKSGPGTPLLLPSVVTFKKACQCSDELFGGTPVADGPSLPRRRTTRTPE